MPQHWRGQAAPTYAKLQSFLDHALIKTKVSKVTADSVAASKLVNSKDSKFSLDKKNMGSLQRLIVSIIASKGTVPKCCLWSDNQDERERVSSQTAFWDVTTFETYMPNFPLFSRKIYGKNRLTNYS